MADASLERSATPMADNLSEYRAKRDFKKTSEPRGQAPIKPSNRWRFVIQKHDATRLHDDLRLELDGVLKSWAVTKGPSLNPHDKRLAVGVEDHPLDYGDFEGTIPRANMGATSSSRFMASGCMAVSSRSG
jgi:bifunctional non-homologous end joining protein LigD